MTDEPGQPTMQVRRARLKVVGGPDKGKQKDVRHFRVVVGGGKECDLMLTDQAVSRRHFELVPTDTGFRLHDLGSTNGTTVKGLKVGDVELTGGEQIKIGQTKLRLVVLEEHDEYPLSPNKSFGPVLGRSVLMRQVFAVLERTAGTEAILLLEGESGTGKDLAAETVHQFSPRKDGPFVVVDCGTIQSSLMESELFGHKQGAYTGADRDRPGAFESANSGTVFLDEIGELDLSVQPKLLRLLENREVKRLGENKYRPVDVRLIAATNRDLSAEVEARRFREDLYYRLSVVQVHFPPLRDRRGDIEALARSFVRKLRPDLNPDEVITKQALAMFQNHDWPGNVRELRNVIERLLLFPDRPKSALMQSRSLSKVEELSPQDVDVPFHEARREWTDRFEKAYLSAILDACNGVVSRAAKQAGIARQTFYRLLEKHKFTLE